MENIVKLITIISKVFGKLSFQSQLLLAGLVVVIVGMMGYIYLQPNTPPTVTTPQIKNSPVVVGDGNTTNSHNPTETTTTTTNFEGGSFGSVITAPVGTVTINHNESP